METNEKKLQRRAFLSSIAALICMKVQQIPMDTGNPSHWMHAALRFIPRFGFYFRK